MAAPAYRGKRWRNLVAGVLERDGWRCHLCGGRIDPYARAGSDEAGTADHLEPIAHGGKWWEPANLAAAHIRCNRRRGSGGRRKVYPARAPWV